MSDDAPVCHKTIFSQKAYFYKHSRPKYPDSVFEYLARLLKSGSKIVEFGCGTGIFTKDLIKYGYEIYAVEPCAEMLAECRAELIDYDKLTFIESSAEEVSLPAASIDAFIFPQSLHWMNIDKLKNIIANAANNHFKIITVWNSRNSCKTDCAKEYNKIINNYKKEHALSIQVQTDSYELLNQLYGKDKYKLFKFHHTHQVTQQGLEYLFQSTSDIDLNLFDLVIKEELSCFFHKYNVNGFVSIEYDCFMAISRN